MSFSNVEFMGGMRLDNVHAQNRKLTYSELIEQDYKYLIKANLGAKGVFNSNATLHINSVQIDTSRILVSFYSSALSGVNLVIINNVGSAITSPISLGSGLDSQIIGMTKISSGKILIAYGIGSAEGRCRIVEIDGSNNITLGSVTKFNSARTTYIDCATISSSIVAIAYRDYADNYSKVQILNISGTTITANESSETKINTIYGTTYNNIKFLQSGKLFVSYILDSDFKVYGQVLSYSGTTITRNTANNISSSSSDYLDVGKIDSGTLVVVYEESNLGYAQVVKISGNTVVTNTSKQYSTGTSKFNSVTIVSSILAVVGYSEGGGATNDYCTYRILTINDSSIVLEDEETILSNQTQYQNTILSGTSNVLVLYQNTLGGQYASSNLLSSIVVSSEKVDYEQIWNSTYTNFLANFEDDLEAGNVDTGGVAITGWRLKRKAEDGSLFVTLDDFDSDEFSYIDMLPRNNINYTYVIFSLGADGESLGIESIESVNFFGWILTDGTNSYKFDIGWDGLSTSTIESNKDNHIYDNYTQYPIISFGERNYKTSSLTTIPYNYNSTDLENAYEINTEVLNEIEAFINNDEEKWLKNTAGEIFKVTTSNFKYKYNDKIHTQPFDITFDWVEVAVGESGL